MEKEPHTLGEEGLTKIIKLNNDVSARVVMLSALSKRPALRDLQLSLNRMSNGVRLILKRNFK